MEWLSNERERLDGQLTRFGMHAQLAFEPGRKVELHLICVEPHVVQFCFELAARGEIFRDVHLGVEHTASAA